MSQMRVSATGGSCTGGGGEQVQYHNPATIKRGLSYLARERNKP